MRAATSGFLAQPHKIRIFALSRHSMIRQTTVITKRDSFADRRFANAAAEDRA